MEQYFFQNFYSPGEDFEDSSLIFQKTTGFSPRRLPGDKNKFYIPFGDDDQLPFQVEELIASDEVTSQNKLFNILTCYSAGLRLFENGEETKNQEVISWQRRNFLPYFFLQQITDMKYFFFAVSVIILSKDKKQINRIIHKEAANIRFEQADKNGKINHVFYADWTKANLQADEIEEIALLDFLNPLGDLEERIKQKGGCCKFAMLTKFPTAVASYYPNPYYWAVFRGGSFDEKKMIIKGKKQKLKNHSSIRYKVTIDERYWEKLCEKHHAVDPLARQKLIRKEKEQIRDFLMGLENSGKVWITGSYTTPDNKTIEEVKIDVIDMKKEGGDWNEDMQATANTVCYSDNIHPNLVGAVPGKTQSNNSGSDKRELFTMKQAIEIAWHDLILRQIEVVAEFNGWQNIKPTVPMIQLTTLDEHTDAKKTTL